MKINPQHFDHLKTAINTYLADNPNLVEQYEQGLFNKSDVVQNLQRRFCWDMSYLSGLTKYISTNLYSYLNDAHIETALKAICPTVSRKY